MKAVLRGSLAMVLVWSVLGVTAVRGADDYREITVHVHNPVGSDAGVEVLVKGLSRAAMSIPPEVYAESDRPGAKARGWRFKTDAKGNCTVRFGKFDCWKHQQATGVAEPGYGTYFLIVEPQEDLAGGVSPRVLNFNEEDRQTYKAPDPGRFSIPTPGEEWDADARVLTDGPEASEPVKIGLQRGLDVSGQLVDPQGHPIPNEQVSLWTDLGADTHTGRGGEIFEQAEDTDHAGRFHFHHVYPNLFYLSLLAQEDDRLFWTRTRVRQRWVSGIADAIWPREGETNLAVVIVAARQSPYRYFGKVTDEKGRPVRGAKVEVQASIHGPGGRSDFDDSHSHHDYATTRRDGSYEVRAAGPYVNSFEVTAPGFQDGGESEEGQIVGYDLYEELPYEPGRYDFVLKRK